MTSEKLMHESLPELIENQKILFQKISENEGEITKALEELLTKSSAQIQMKIDNYARFIERAEMEIELCKKEEKESSQTRKSLERAVEGLKFTLKNYMLNSGAREVSGAKYSFKMQSAGFKTEFPVDESFDDWAKEFPHLFKKETVISPDKIAIKDSIQSGVEVPFARLVPVFSIKHEKRLKFLSNGD